MQFTTPRACSVAAVNRPGGRSRIPAGNVVRGLTQGLAPAVMLTLAACGDMPQKAPERVDFPRGTDTTGGEEQREPIKRSETPPFIGDPVDDALFAPVRAALERGSWIEAKLALPMLPGTVEGAVDPSGDGQPTENLPSDRERYESADADRTLTAEPSSTALWHAYYEARIDHLRGALPAYEARMAELQDTALPVGLSRELLQHRLTVAEIADDGEQTLLLAARLYDLGGHEARSREACAQLIWRAAQEVVAEGHSPQVSTGTLAWLDLARAAATPDEPRERAAALQAWLASYGEHPASALATTLAEAALRDAQGDRLALLLPLSGPLAAAGDAVARGAFAAYYADRSSAVTLDVMDSRRMETGEALALARERNTAVVLGPLAKLQVADVLAQPTGDQPVLALNRPEQAATAPGVLQLALAPEDEARQIAELAFSDGKRRALLLRPEGVWGDRIESALRGRWEALGARVVRTARFGKADAYSEVLRAALALDDSTERTRELRRLFGATESTGRRREDLDSIFLLTRGSNEARALKPLIDYHYAGDLPTYALSTADSGNTDRNRDRDLEGLRLLAMPWRLGVQAVPGLEGPDASGSFDALHALGVDAYRLARNWQQLRSPATLRFDGLTATLTADDQGVLRRRLLPAEFDRGTLSRR